VASGKKDNDEVRATDLVALLATRYSFTFHFSSQLLLYSFRFAMTIFATSLSVLFVVASLAVILYREYARAGARKAQLPPPPGPRGLPILGMTAQVMAPGKKHASLFHDWEKQYGGAGILLVPTLFRKQIIIRYTSREHLRSAKRS
jgi:hypothetical protein